MRPSESNREKAKVWTARIEQAEQFRGSTVEFCQKEGLSIHTFVRRLNARTIFLKIS